MVTGVVGASIWITPEHRDVKLTVIESAMNTDYWAAALCIFSALALVCEADMLIRKHERWMSLVAWCHIMLCGLLVGYASAAMAGVLARAAWNFGAPAVGGLMAFWHLMFVKRRPRA